MPKNKNNVPGLPTVAEPMEDEPAVGVLEVERINYQPEQEQVFITAVPPSCPRCGSTERSSLKEISPRLYTDKGCVIRYQTQCLGTIQPVDENGIPVVDNKGKPKTYICGNCYKVKKLLLTEDKKRA
ncbi:hypothetical protein FACS1894170_02780 [Planctomycetales bacterium]|nr:hypothetical protein FACS1894170_02780 [Planctomycetales bacterium]